MFLLLNATRLLFYSLLGIAALFGDIYWWVPIAWILWDTQVHLMIKIPFTKSKVKDSPFNWNNYTPPSTDNKNQEKNDVIKQGRGGKPNSLSLDRINNDLGYIPGNIQVISLLANQMKSIANKAQLIRFADWIYKN